MQIYVLRLTTWTDSYLNQARLLKQKIYLYLMYTLLHWLTQRKEVTHTCITFMLQWWTIFLNQTLFWPKFSQSFLKSDFHEFDIDIIFIIWCEIVHKYRHLPGVKCFVVSSVLNIERLLRVLRCFNTYFTQISWGKNYANIWNRRQMRNLAIICRQ